jgi:hypothetical protein
MDNQMTKLTQTASVINVTTPSATILNLTKAREGYVKGIKKTGDVLRTYSDAMCQAFNLTDADGNVTTPWYDLKGKLAKGIQDERKAFVTDLESGGFTKATAYVYWGRVAEASGKMKSVTKVSGGSVDIDAKTLAELTTIINRIFKHEETEGVDDSKASQAKRHLMDAYSMLGGDVMSLG